MITDKEAIQAVNTICKYCKEHPDCKECSISIFCVRNERMKFREQGPYMEPSPKQINDVVNHPQHYCRGGIETVDIIKAKMPITWFYGYLMGNILKYVTRANYKGSQIEDFKKAAWYLNRLIQELEGDD